MFRRVCSHNTGPGSSSTVRSKFDGPYGKQAARHGYTTVRSRKREPSRERKKVNKKTSQRRRTILRITILFDIERVTSKCTYSHAYIFIYIYIFINKYLPYPYQRRKREQINVYIYFSHIYIYIYIFQLRFLFISLPHILIYSSIYLFDLFRNTTIL